MSQVEGVPISAGYMLLFWSFAMQQMRLVNPVLVFHPERELIASNATHGVNECVVEFHDFLLSVIN